MKNLSIFAFVIILSIIKSFGQDVEFKVEISSDSILAKNYFQVQFILEGASGANFNAPQIIGLSQKTEPSITSEILISNGRKKQSMKFVYLFFADKHGTFEITPASIEVAGKKIKTEPFDLVIHSNPEGKKQHLKKTSKSIFSDDFFFQKSNTKKFGQLNEHKNNSKRKIYKL